LVHGHGFLAACKENPVVSVVGIPMIRGDELCGLSARQGREDGPMGDLKDTSADASVSWQEVVPERELRTVNILVVKDGKIEVGKMGISEERTVIMVVE
jgi:hypothetical protein